MTGPIDPTADDDVTRIDPSEHGDVTDADLFRPAGGAGTSEADETTNGDLASADDTSPGDETSPYEETSTADETVDPGEEPVRSGPTLSWGMLAGIGALIVALSFGAAFLGARLAVPAPAASPVETPAAKPTATPTAAPLVLPAGADIRAGVGLPDSAHGEEGDIFIDIDSADVFVRRADGWSRAGNIRTSAQENLTGEQGDQGKQGEQGDQGDRGKPGEAGASGDRGAQGDQGQPGVPGKPGLDGTQVVLGVETPGGSCSNEGDVFVNTVEVAFYQCTSGSWSQVS